MTETDVSSYTDRKYSDGTGVEDPYQAVIEANAPFFQALQNSADLLYYIVNGERLPEMRALTP